MLEASFGDTPSDFSIRRNEVPRQPLTPASMVKRLAVHSPSVCSEIESRRPSYFVCFLIAASATFSSNGQVSSISTTRLDERDQITMSGRRGVEQICGGKMY